MINMVIIIRFIGFKVKQTGYKFLRMVLNPPKMRLKPSLLPV